MSPIRPPQNPWSNSSIDIAIDIETAQWLNATIDIEVRTFYPHKKSIIVIKSQYINIEENQDIVIDIDGGQLS